MGQGSVPVVSESVVKFTIQRARESKQNNCGIQWKKDTETEGDDDHVDKRFN